MAWDLQGNIKGPQGSGSSIPAVIQDTMAQHVSLKEPSVYQGVTLTIGTTAPAWINQYIPGSTQGSRFRVVGPPLQPDGLSPSNYWAMWNGSDPSTSVVAHEQSFLLKGPRISGMFMSYGPTDLQFLADGQLVKPSFSLMSEGAGHQFVTLEFTDDTDPNKIRLIRGFFGQMGLLQWLLPTAGAMYADITKRFTIGIAAADSFYHGAGGTTEGAISAGSMGQMMSIMTGGSTQTINAGAQGGTGYRNAGTGTQVSPGPNGQTRFGATNRINAFKLWASQCDVIMLGGGANDTDFATYPLADTVAAAIQTWTDYGAAAPTKPLVVIGVQAGVYPSMNANLDALNAALKAAALAHPRVAGYLDDRANFPMAGTSQLGQPPLGDNADILRSSDGVHYSRFANKLLTFSRIAMMAEIALKINNASGVNMTVQEVTNLIDEAIAAAGGGSGGSSRIEVVTTLPTTGTPGVLYVTTVT